MKNIDDLQQIKGIGAVLAKRLRDAGLDSFQKIADAGEDGLNGIRGINHRALSGIVQQATELSQVPEDNAEERKKALSERAAVVREQLQALASEARERFAEKLSGKSGKRLSDDLIRMVDALDRMAENSKRPKRSEKALAKVQRKMAALEQAKLKKFCKGFRKSRKTLAELAK